MTDPLGRVSDLVAGVDAAVPVAVEPASTLLPDDAPVIRWVGPVFVVLAVALLPWTVYLAVTLPQRKVSHNYDLAWVGFDVGLFLALIATAWTALRRSSWVVSTATVTATMLCVDAWFDVVTSGHEDWPQALVSAVLVELPLAGVCAWLARHGHQLVERRLRLLLRARPNPGRVTPHGQAATSPSSDPPVTSAPH